LEKPLFPLESDVVAADDTVICRTSLEATELLVSGMISKWELVKHRPSLISFSMR